MTEPDKESGQSSVQSLIDELPLDELKKSAQDLMLALAERAAGAVTGKVDDLTQQLTGQAGQGGPGMKAVLSGGKALAQGKSPVKAILSGGKDMVMQSLTGGGEDKGSSGGSGGTVKVTNILEKIDVGVPIRVAYNQWTQFQEFPEFTRKVENVEQESDETVTWTAQIFLSHRTWKATIVEQVPEDKIVWTSEGSKGFVNGAVTFHALAPNMTRILLVLEYHPQGFFEKTGNIWRAPGRRARADFRHFERYVMTQTVRAPDEVEGWRGEIRDGEVVKTHDEAMQEEQQASGDESSEEDQYSEQDYEDEDYEEDYDEQDEQDEEGDEDEQGYDDEDYEDEDYDEGDAEEEDEEEEESKPRPDVGVSAWGHAEGVRSTRESGARTWLDSVVRRRFLRRRLAVGCETPECPMQHG